MRTLRYSPGLLALACLTKCDELPYNPTRIFVPPNSSYAYVFQPSPNSQGQAQLSTMDFSDPISPTNRRLSTISETLPFLQDDEVLPYTPAVDANGEITVFTGRCSGDADGAQVWRLESSSDGTWKQYNTSDQNVEVYGSVTGPNFLSNAIAFSSSLDSDNTDTSMFVFGGMCPSGTGNVETWASDAQYSNLMLDVSLLESGHGYGISLPGERGPPIAQAGTSITPLTPTYSIDSDGNVQTQQQDSVLLGGHTEAAFINMSQVALFSLPQQTWSFMPVIQPSDGKSDLAVKRDTLEVTPRSGHTAILSESGTSIILFGGWVGSVNTPADPQLAILELGAGYGGTGEWIWTVPPQSRSGVAEGSGIYGHGAAMLPGGVMMVVGGYQILGDPSSRIKRDTQAVNDRILFYNTTSNSWLDSYSLPDDAAKQLSDSIGPLSTKSQKIGLGTGLSIGAALLLSVVAFYLWYSRRLKQARETRERTLMTYSLDGSSAGHIDQPFLNHGGVDGREGDEAAHGRFWPTGGDAGGCLPRPPPMQHTTGMWVNVPSPTRGLRKGAPGKSYQYQPAPHFDDSRMSRASGQIHSIAEQENEDENEQGAEDVKADNLSDAELKLNHLQRVLMSNDPFADSEPKPLGSHPVTSDTLRRVPTAASKLSTDTARPLSGEQSTENWAIYEEAEDEGRSTPSQSDDRTSSTLSERSQRSVTSTNSITRTMSTRTGAIMAAAAAAHRAAQTAQEVSPTEESTQTMTTFGSRSSTNYFTSRARSSTNGSLPPITAGTDAESFATARSNFVQLQSEGEALLGGRPGADPDDPYQRALVAHTSTRTAKPHLYSNNAPPPAIPPRRRPAGLFGSLRRALNAVSLGERTLSLTSSPEYYRDDVRSSSSSPTKDRGNNIGTTPRRAVSDGGALLRQKRGQKDWDEKEFPPYHDDPNADDWGEPGRQSHDRRQAEEDWDVEGAAGNRDFQVMFTVPKSRLRVVNDDMDRASLRSASDSAVSRQGSLKTVRHEDSMKALRARSEGHRLSAMEEEGDETEKEKAA